VQVVNKIYIQFYFKELDVKPLLEKEIDSFLKRFDFFKDSEFRNIEVISPTTIKISLAGQDSARGFDWVSVDLEFSGVSDACILDNSKLAHVNISDGISIICENRLFTFGIGEYSTTSSLKNSICHITSSNIKYQEGQF
jgi:hypothetical protein